jgi:hypothetical protein
MDRADGRPLNVLDAELAWLRERFPAWRVWWIRNAVSRAVSWHAQPSASRCPRRFRTSSPGSSTPTRQGSDPGGRS